MSCKSRISPICKKNRMQKFQGDIELYFSYVSKKVTVVMNITYQVTYQSIRILQKCMEKTCMQNSHENIELIKNKETNRYIKRSINMFLLLLSQGKLCLVYLSEIKQSYLCNEFRRNFAPGILWDVKFSQFDSIHS